MIPMLMRVRWLGLRRDRVALVLTFVLPIIFFSIFAMIFGGMGSGGGGGTSSITVAAVDEDGTQVSRRFLEALDEQDALRVITAPAGTDDAPSPGAFDRDGAIAAVRGGDVSIAIVVPSGFADAFGSFDPAAAPIEVLYDEAQPIAVYTVTGLLQAAAFTAAPDVLMARGLELLEDAGGALTPDQQSAVGELMPFLKGEQPWTEFTTIAEDESEDESEGGAGGGDDDTVAPVGEADEGFTPALVQVEQTNVRAEADRSYSIATYYAAGIGVMFLLFSMAGAAGTLMEEEESGRLERLLGAGVPMSSILGGSWLFFAALGFAQLTVMFTWGALLFDVDLFTLNHLGGFVVVATITSAAAAAFGVLLATMCRTQAQMSGISTVVILIMSALGGSMVPRFVMPAFMEVTSRFTFNGWALDAFLEVFWYDDPAQGLLASLAAIGLPLAVLGGMTAAFLGVARVLARRWETV